MWAQYKMSSPKWQQIYAPVVEKQESTLPWNGDCTCLVHFKASDECGWKWIKLIWQPQFERNKQANCVASRCASRLQYGHVFRLVWMWLWVWTGPSQRVHLVFSPSRSQGPSSSQHRHGISWHAGKLKSKCPVKQHDDDAEHPFKDGWCVLQDEALLTEKHTAWKHVKDNNSKAVWMSVYKVQMQNSDINPVILNTDYEKKQLLLQKTNIGPCWCAWC